MNELIINQEEDVQDIKERFVSYFCCGYQLCLLLWRTLKRQSIIPRGDSFDRKHLLWTLLFLKLYNTNLVMADMCKCDVKTFRKQVWEGVEFLVALKEASATTH